MSIKSSLVISIILLSQLSHAQETAQVVMGALWAFPTLMKTSASEKADTSKRIFGRCQVAGNSSLDNLCRQIPLKLLDANGAVIQSTSTDSSGFFEFYDVPKGEYAVVAGFSNFKIDNNGKLKPGEKVSMQITE